ncbi:MAG: membrane dipeptidase [Pseudomonadota bacterium]
MKTEYSRATHSARLVSIAVSALLGVASADSDTLDVQALALNKKLLNVDAHTDVLIASTPERYWAPGHGSRTSVDKLDRGSIDVLTIAVAVGPGPRTPAGIAAARAEANEKLATIRKFVSDHPDRLAIALSADDIERIHKHGKIAVVESFLNARSLGNDVNGIDEFAKAGVRVFALTHAGNNDFADSSRPTNGEGQEHHGLSPLGKRAITRLNQLGVIVDVSQLTPDGVFQALKITKAPIIASHSNVRTLIDNTRNLSDPELDAIKANGGVVSVTPFNAYLAKLPADFGSRVSAVRTRNGLKAAFPGSAYTDGYDALPEKQQSAFIDEIQAIYPKATVKEYVDHIDYLVKRIGVEHVGIGTDFNHGSGVTGFNDEGDANNVTREFLSRGYTEDQIAKIWGENFLRVFRQVEVVARNSQRAG